MPHPTLRILGSRFNSKYFLNPLQMSGLEVISSISAIISILDAAVKIYDKAHSDIKLPETFEVVRRRLPIILHTLNTYESHLISRKDSLPEDVWTALNETVDTCEKKARSLTEIFEKIFCGQSDTWRARYWKLLRGFGKGNKVEELMLGLTEDVQSIVNHHAVMFTNTQQQELEDIIGSGKEQS